MKLYPIRLSPGKFHGTAKIHELSANQGAEGLPQFRTLVSNINTATYELAPYSVKTLSLLSPSEFTVWSGKEFTDLIR